MDIWARFPWKRRVIGLLVIATIVKAIWAANSLGLDTVYFATYGKLVTQNGLEWMYGHPAVLFNHTPFTSCICVGLHLLVGGDVALFVFLFRALSIAADAFMVLGLIRLVDSGVRIPWWSIAVFAISPVSIMVSGFHGNVDPIMIALLFFAVVYALEKKPLVCGLFLGLSCNIKVLPLMFIPIFLIFWMQWTRGMVLRFGGVLFSLLIAGFAFPMLQYTELFVHKVVAYSGQYGSWGITYWLRVLEIPGYSGLAYNGITPQQKSLMSVLKAAVIILSVYCGWFRRRATDATGFFKTISICWVLLFVLSPAESPHYMVWFAPFFAVSLPRFSIWMTLVATLHVAVCYGSFSISPFPWYAASPFDASTASVNRYFEYGLAPWLSFVALGLFWLWEWWRLSRHSLGNHLEVKTAS